MKENSDLSIISNTHGKSKYTDKTKAKYDQNARGTSCDVCIIEIRLSNIQRQFNTASNKCNDKTSDNPFVTACCVWKFASALKIEFLHTQNKIFAKLVLDIVFF